MKHLIAAAMAAAWLPAHAVLSDVTGANYSFDSASGLQWLDVKETVGQSYNDVVAGSFIAGGWRYATKEEVTALFASNLGQPAAPAEMSTLAAALGGWTAESAAGAPAASRFSGIFDAGSFRSLATMQVSSTCAVCTGALVGTTSFADTVRDRYGSESGLVGGSGSFLVRAVTPVPEPGSVALMAVGLFGVLLAARVRNGPTAACRLRRAH